MVHIFSDYITTEGRRLKMALDRDFPGASVVKNLPANAGDMGSSPSLGTSHMLQSN